MKEEEQLEAQYKFIKLVICLQAALELFDELEGTPYFKRSMKNSVNNTKGKIEVELEKTFRFINSEEKEETFISIDRAVHQIMDESLEDLFIKGYRE